MVPASVTEFLRRDELRHITPLKMLTLFGDALRVVPIRAAASNGYLFVMPIASSQWDRVKYPNAVHSVYVALPVNAGSELIAAAALHVLRETSEESFVIKTIERSLIDALHASRDSRTPLRYQLALLTFTPQHANAATGSVTADGVNTASANAACICYDHIPNEACALLAAHNVYSETELETMFADGSARCWLRVASDAPVAVALTFANSKMLHEIGSLYVRPDARRSRHAEALVRAALHDLAARGLKIRYVVDAENAASIALAKRCGLREALRSEHWLSN
jgi:ribosomal protein S18 acetylase RimI-like enzyme